jgi:transcriptional regulator with XRE-family HTH domain
MSGEPMRARDDASASPRRVFGAMLRYYRTRAGLSQDQLGARVYLSSDMIGKVEQGQRTPSEQFVEACEAIPELGANGALRELRGQLKDLLQQRAYPGWFADWPDIEARARSLKNFQLAVVPGLLQTEDYARALLTDRIGRNPDDIDDMVAARIERQAILDREQPPELWVVVDEAVLHRPVGGTYVMRDQLQHLIEMSRTPSIVLQVIPASVGVHDGLPGAGFVIAEFRDAPGVSYQETAVRGQVIEDADDVGVLASTWDRLRAEALPRSASLELAEEIRKSWS